MTGNALGSEGDLLASCAMMPRRELPEGMVLIEAGTRPGEMYVLESGSLTIEREGTVFARVDHPGAIFGEMSVVLDAPASGTVVAEARSAVRVIADPAAFMIENPRATLTILRTVAARLDGMTRYLVDVKAQLADMPGHLGMVGRILDTLVHHQPAPTRSGSVRDPDA